MKICRICSKEKDETEYYMRKDTGKLRNECIECVKERSMLDYEENKEEKLENNKKYAQTHREKINKIGKKHRDANLEKESKRHKIYYEKHKKERQKYKKQRWQNDEQFRIIECLRTRLRSAFKKYSINGKVLPSKKYGIDFQKIFEYIGPCPGLENEYHIDHIKPLCSFDFDDPEQVKSAFVPENHRWLKKEDNLKKSAIDKSLKRE